MGRHRKGSGKECREVRNEENNEERQYRRMTETPVSELVLQLGIPTIISMLITNIYNMGDTYFVSKIGTSASGAVGIVFSLMAILQAFGFMFGHGAGSVISRKLGRKDTQSARRYASTSFFLSFAVGLLIMLLGLCFLDAFMQLLGSTKTILPYAKAYGFYILLAAPFLTASCVMNNILRYEGRAIYAMAGLTAGGILNLIGDPIFMFGLHMGVAGAGLSTALSQIISFGILLYPFLRGKTQSSFSIQYVTKDWKETAEIVRVGFPSMVRQGLNSISIMLLNHQAAVYGDAAVAAMSIVNRISMFIFSTALGIGQGYQPVAAFNYGAGKYRRVKKGFWFTAFTGEILLGVCAAAGLLWARPILELFRKDPEVVAIGVRTLRFQCVSCFFQPVSICTNMVFQSIGKSGKATFLAALRNGFFFIPLLLILPALFGLTGVQLSQTIADMLTFAVSLPLLFKFLKTLPADSSA